MECKECKVWSVICKVWSVSVSVKCGVWSPAETHRVSQSATPATQNDMSTSSDTSRKTRCHGFSHRHGNFSATTVAHRHSG